jgi:2-polyprenyl-6-methoxyphenol hydroxylase-like FAD-dependent oxidoreductase
MSNLNVLISGSGIAGSVFASCLLRAHPNASITIVERDPELRLTGASVDIRSSAVDIIKWMDAEQEIRNQSTHEEGIQIVDDNGKEVATFRATGKTDIQSFTSEYEIFRGELAKIFIDPIVDQVKLIFDETVDHFEQQDDGVVVTFTKSKEVKKYDLLVAADGLGSKIRGVILNTKSWDQFHDEGVHIAYFTVKGDLLQGSHLAKGCTATKGRAVFLRPDPNPAGRTRAIFMNITRKGDVETKQRLDKAVREGNESYMTVMEEMYGDVGWLTPEVLKGMRESDDFYCSQFGQIRSPKLHDGRVVLLGDAGYATPGIGTSLAIIGGYVLAGELLTHPDNVKLAVERYEGILMPFVKSSQGGGPGDFAMQLLNPQTQLGIKIRNTVLAFVSRTKLDQLVMTVASKMGVTEKKVSMPDYQWPAK